MVPFRLSAGPKCQASWSAWTSTTIMWVTRRRVKWLRSVPSMTLNCSHDASSDASTNSESYASPDAWHDDVPYSLEQNSMAPVGGPTPLGSGRGSDPPTSRHAVWGSPRENTGRRPDNRAWLRSPSCHRRRWKRHFRVEGQRFGVIRMKTPGADPKTVPASDPRVAVASAG